MPMNRIQISASLAPQQAEAIKQAIAEIHKNLPFLIDLTADERQGMLKLGDKNRSFVAKAAAVAEQNSDILPRNFKLEEMQTDIKLIEDLYPIIHAVTVLLGKLEDTYFAAGSEAYAASLMVYQYAKAANISTGVLEGALDDLGRRFARHSRAAAPAAAETASSAPAA